MTETARSRRTWPGPMSTAGVEPGHEHELPRALLRRIRLLTRVVVIFGVCLAALTFVFVMLIQSRSAERNEQNERTNQRINDAICDLLDQLPEGVLLDRPRSKYGCGPGIPLDQLTPEEQQQLNGSPQVVVPPLPSGVEVAPDGFEFSGGADPNVERAEPYYPTPGVAEPPATVPYPEGFPPPDPVQPPALTLPTLPPR